MRKRKRDVKSHGCSLQGLAETQEAYEEQEAEAVPTQEHPVHDLPPKRRRLKRKRKCARGSTAKPLALSVQVPKSRFWDLEASLCSSSVEELRSSRIGGPYDPPSPSPEQELCRAAAVQALREAFSALCATHTIRTGGSPIFFDKWHCAWMQQAAAAALEAGALVPPEPVLPKLRSKGRRGPDAYEVLDEALIKGLAFVDKAKTRALAEDLRGAADAAAKKLAKQLKLLDPSGRAQISDRHDGACAALQYKHMVVEVSRGHLQKLRYLYRGDAEAGFVDSAFCCLLRYQSVLQRGFQGACTAEVFAALKELFDARFECFASPLNCRYRSMCSAFPDTDAAFGSLGSFFALNPQSGSFQLNPPFLDDIITAMASRLEVLLAAADARKSVLTFLVIVVANQGSRSGSAALRTLEKHAFCRAQLVCQKNKHCYYDGDQHASEESRLSPCDTAVYILQSRQAYKENAPTPERLAQLRESFTKGSSS